MNRGLVLVLCAMVALLLIACDSKREDVQVAAEDDAPVKAEPSFEGIQASQTNVEEMGDMLKPIIFLSVVVDEEPTPGTLPPAPGGTVEPDPADHSIRRVVYATRAMEDIPRIAGLRIVHLPAQRPVPGFAPKALNRIRATLEYGPVDKIRFGIQGPPTIPDHPPVIGDQQPEQTPDADTDAENPLAPSADTPSAPPATGGSADTETVTRVFEKDFILNESGKPQYWEFQQPIDVQIPFGAGIQLTVEYLVPELYPTIGIIQPGDIQLAIPDRYREQSEVQTLSPISEKRPSACVASPRGQLVCLYTSGVAELYVQAPFVKVALVGTWKRVENTLTIETTEQTWTFDVADPNAPLDFGLYGDGYKVITQGDDRLHPYYDLARELGGDQPFKPEAIRHVYHAQLDQENEPEAIAEFVDGGFAAFNRADAFSPYRIMMRVESAKASIQVLTVPMTNRSFVAIKGEQDETWTVYAYDSFSKSFVTFTRKTVPWKSWEPGGDQTSEPIRREQGPDEGVVEPPAPEKAPDAPAAPEPPAVPEPGGAAPAVP